MMSPVLTEIDFARHGKQVGTLRVPYSRNSSAWGVVPTPIAVIQNGDGPTVYLNAGTHGGEPEGPVCLFNLIRKLEPGHIRGRLIITPALNLLAVRAGERLCPADQKDLNRVFPGDSRGTLSQVIAHYVAECIVPLADVVVDLHSGGTSLQLLPYTSMHYLEDQALHARTFAAMQAFGAPYSLLIREFSGSGLLDYEVESCGKVFLCPELGSAGVLEPETLSIAESGVYNVLKHFRLLPGDSVPNEMRTFTDPKLIEIPDPSHYYAAKSSGIYEPFVTLGCIVTEGQFLGQLHSLDNFARSPETVVAEQTGILLGRRAPGVTEVGDCIAVIARTI